MVLVLASNSPRRRQLLENSGIQFVVQPASVEETLRTGERAEEFVCRMAQEKALSVAPQWAPGSLVLGADTTVEVDGQILGKPKDAEEAERMLRLLSGKIHHVLTGVCIARAPDHIEALQYEATQVSFRPLNDNEIRTYVASGEPFDKAGGYAIQGLASKFVTRVEGCFFNVVGLPVSLVYGVLKNLREAPPHL